MEKQNEKDKEDLHNQRLLKTSEIEVLEAWMGDQESEAIDGCCEEAGFGSKEREVVGEVETVSEEGAWLRGVSIRQNTIKR